MSRAADLDAADPLAGFAAQFAKPPGTVYMDGNSLGLLCRPAEESLHEAVEMWRSLAIRGWTEGPEPWFGLSRKVAGLLAPLLGANAQAVMVGQSTTVNLHQVLATFYEPPGRVLIDGTHFPTDRYAVESHLRLRGLDPGRSLAVVETGADRLLDEDAIIGAMDDVTFAVLPSVVYTTGQLLDMRAITEAGRERGVLVAWDCSHSAGVIPHRFVKDEIDLAFGCTYKYLNGGPGAVGWLFADWEPDDGRPGMAGWFGSDPERQFAMSAEFHPAGDAGQYLMGTPHVLSLAPLVGSLQLVADAGLNRIRAKSLAQTGFLRELAERRLARFGVGCATPQEDRRRGGHVSLTHPEAGKLSRALRKRGVIPDFRPPDMIRLAPSPLYTPFAECEHAVGTLEEILAHCLHHRIPDYDAGIP
jgi:kynureninase